MRLWTRSWTGPLVFLVAALVVAAVFAAAYRYAGFDRARTVASAQRELANIAMTMGAHNAEALNDVEADLRQIAAGGGKDAKQAVLAYTGERGMVLNILTVDAQGRVVDVSGRGRYAESVADRDYFAWHRRNRSARAFIGRPVFGRVSGEWILPVSVRVDAPNGEFGGVIVASIRPAYFNTLYSKPRLGEHAAVTLVGTDGFVRVRRGLQGPGEHDDLRASSAIRLQRGVPHGNFVSTGAIDGVQRFVSYYTLPGHPSLIVLVGRDTDDVLAAHRTRIGYVWWMAGTTSAAVLLVALAVWAAIRRERRHATRLRESEARYRGIYENAVEGIFVSTPDGRFLRGNPAMLRLMGIPQGEPVPNVRTLYADPSRRDDFVAGMAADGYVADFEFQMRRHDGSLIWASTTAWAVRGPDGRITRYEGFISDVSSRRNEQALREQASALALQRYQELLERLGKLASGLAKAWELPAVYRAVLEFAAQSAPMNGMFISLYEEASNQRRCVFAWSDGAEVDVSSLPPLPMSTSPHSRSVATGEVVVTPDFQAAVRGSVVHNIGCDADPRLPQSSLVVPMQLMGRVLGGVEIQCLERDAYRGEHVVALSVAAPLVASAIENVRLLAEERGHRSRAEKAERRVVAILESALDAIVALDADARVIDFNPAAEKIFGSQRDAVIGRPICDVIAPPELRESYAREIALYMRNGACDGTGERFEFTAMRSGGARFPAEASIVQALGIDPPLFTGFIRDITERKGAEEALRESEARYRKVAGELAHIMDQSVDAICAFDRHGRFIHVSAACEAIWHCPSEELVGRDVCELVHPEDMEATRRAIRRVASGHPTRDFENRQRRKDGTYADLMWSARWLPDEEVMFCVARDVTETKLMQHANMLLADRLHDTVERLAAGFVTVNAAWCFTYVNRAAEEMNGKPREELLGREIWDAIPIADPFADEYRRVMRERTAGVVEAFHEHYGRWFEARVYPTQDGGLALYIIDATERHRAMALLEQSEQRFEHVARATSDAIFDWTVGAEEIRWTDGILTLYGHEPSSAVRTVEGFERHIHPDDRARARSALDAAIASGQDRISIEYRFRRADGTYATVLHSASIMRDASGRAFRIIAGLSDITERRDLERQVMRTQRLESLGTLASGIAHDLNNVFTPIAMGLNLLDEDRLGDEHRGIIRTIRASAMRGADMVKQVVAFARGMEGQRVDVQPRLVLQELERLMRETFPRNIDIAFVAPSRLPTITGDPTQLHQVLLNLCVNARDAMPSGGKLLVRTACATLPSPLQSVCGGVAAGAYVRFDVEDTGCGMDEQTLERVFEPFFTTKKHGEGTGLGLSTTLAIVRKHAGHIDVRSRVGEGSSFSVWLPVSQSAGGQSSQVAGGALLRGSGETVLVVDDEPEIRDLTARMLRSAGFHVRVAAHGEEALEQWQRASSIDILFTDMMMPVMDGHALARALRERDPGIAIVCSSGITVDRASLPPSAVFLAKPYTPATLVGAMLAALRARPAHARALHESADFSSR